MHRIGFLTAPQWPDLTPDDLLVAPYLQLAGIELVPAIWTEPLPEGLDALVMRSTWGYFEQIQTFVAWLRGLESVGIPLQNPLTVLLDNLDKRYLLRLQARGHAIIPTRLLEVGKADSYAELAAHAGWPELIVKPVISASGYETHRLRADQPLPPSLVALNAHAALLVQPFCPEIQTEGEWSLIFFNRRFSHAVLKRPASGNFLIHEHHGGVTAAAAPPPQLLALAQAVVNEACADCLYARVDCVRHGSGFAIMELELLEPALYLAHEPGAAARWAAEIKKGLGVRDAGRG